jgi:hypothetical protein
MAGKQKGLTAAQWLEVRKAYETEEPTPTITALSVRFGVKRETIGRHRDDKKQPGGPWIPKVGLSPANADAVASLAQAKTLATVTDIASRRAVADMEADGTLAKLTLETRTAMELAARIELRVLQLVDQRTRRALVTDPKGMADPDTGEILMPLRGGSHTSEAGETKDLVAAANLANEMSRTMRGLRPGDSSIDEEDKKRKFRRFIFVTPDEIKKLEDEKNATAAETQTEAG